MFDRLFEFPQFLLCINLGFALAFFVIYWITRFINQQNKIHLHLMAGFLSSVVVIFVIWFPIFSKMANILGSAG